MSVEFLYPKFLWLLLLLPIVVWFVIWSERQRRQVAVRLGHPNMMRLLSQHISTRRRGIKAALWVGCVAALSIALARPLWGVQTSLVQTEGASVYLLLDVSNSMNAEDIQPSRLERAKIGLSDLLDGVRGNEVGLIAFAGRSVIVFPLTTDVQSARTFLNYVSSDMITRQGTAIDDAIQLALDSFILEQGSSQVIVVLSDGEDHNEAIDEAIASAVDRGVTIHTVGYGTVGGGSIPIRNNAGLVVGNKQDRQGNTIITVLNEPVLEALAVRTGGLYQRIDASGVAIENIITLINNAEGGMLSEEERVNGVERFVWLAGLALLLLTIEMLIPETQS